MYSVSLFDKWEVKDLPRVILQNQWQSLDMNLSLLIPCSGQFVLYYALCWNNDLQILYFVLKLYVVNMLKLANRLKKAVMGGGAENSSHKKKSI